MACLWLISTLHIPSRTCARKDTNVQDVLSGFLAKLGIDHPYHVLYQLLSLQNGNRDNKGNVDNSGSSKGGLQQNVDVDKIQAAASVIRKIAQRPSR